MSAPTVLRTHNGFGDVIYERPVIKALAGRPDLYLATAFPEMFADLGIPMVPATSGLAWSNRNQSARQAEGVYAELPAKPKHWDLRIKVHRAQLRSRSMVDVMAQVAGVKVSSFDLPPLPEVPISGRFALIRPVTVRGDWPHPSRNPDPAYMRQAADMLRDAGYRVVSVAAISEIEPYIGEPPFADVRFDRGELGPLELLALTKAASLVVTGPGWAVPAALACGTPLVVICGGAGITNGPRALVPDWYDGPVRCITPEPFCVCVHKRHNCNKRIPDFARRFTEATQFDRSRAA